MAMARGAPLLPVHSMKHTKKKRSGGWGMRIFILAVIAAVMCYAFFAVNYVGTSAQRKQASTTGRTLTATDANAGEGSIQQYEDVAEDGVDEESHVTSTIGRTETDSEQQHSKHAKAKAPDPSVNVHVGTEHIRVAKAKSPDAAVNSHGETEQQKTHGPDQHAVKTSTEDAAEGAAHAAHVQHVNVQQVKSGPQNTDAVPEAHAPVIHSVHGEHGAHVEAENGTAKVAQAHASAITAADTHKVEADTHKVEADSTSQLHAEKATAPEIHTHEDQAHDAVAQHAQLQVPAQSPSAIQAQPLVDTGLLIAHLKPPQGAAVVNGSHSAAGGGAAAGGLYALEALDIDGKVRKLSEFAGKVTLVVNVASACGYTDENYKGLMEVYEKYHKHGLEILGFPCNQFGSQESGSETQIKDFCTTKYHVSFPMFSKVEVNGPGTHPVFQYLKTHLPVELGGGGGKGPGKDLVWNFQKFLVDKKGNPVKFFMQTYDRIAIEHAVYAALHAQ